MTNVCRPESQWVAKYIVISVVCRQKSKSTWHTHKITSMHAINNNRSFKVFGMWLFRFITKAAMNHLHYKNYRITIKDQNLKIESEKNDQNKRVKKNAHQGRYIIVRSNCNVFKFSLLLCTFFSATTLTRYRVWNNRKQPNEKDPSIWKWYANIN